MLHTFVVYVENKPGVLSRVVSLFRRRAFNIDSLTVGRTEKPDVSRMTIVTDADEDQARRIVANVYKLVNVLLVDDVTRPAGDCCAIWRSIKVAATPRDALAGARTGQRLPRPRARPCGGIDHHGD